MGDASGLAMGRKDFKGATAKAEVPSAARAVLSAALRVRVFFIPNGYRGTWVFGKTIFKRPLHNPTA